MHKENYHIIGNLAKKEGEGTSPLRRFEDLKRLGHTIHARHNRNLLKSRRDDLFIEEMDSRISEKS